MPTAPSLAIERTPLSRRRPREHPPIPRVNLTSNLLSYPSTIHSVHVCRRADDAAPLAVKVVSLSSKADGGGTMVISAGSASRIAAEVRALRALDGTGGSIPTDDDDDNDVDASRSLFPRFHDFYLAPSSSPVGGWDAHLVSSMCPGNRDLRAYLRAARDRGRCGLPESQARFYLAELAAALHAVHTVARLAHGDVKPENVAVSSATGHISLVDFDLSTDLGDRGVQRVGSPAMDENCQKVGTRVVVAGTEAYMSPELIAGDPRDAASDWWAFAVVAYELRPRSRSVWIAKKSAPVLLARTRGVRARSFPRRGRGRTGPGVVGGHEGYDRGDDAAAGGGRLGQARRVGRVGALRVFRRVDTGPARGGAARGPLGDAPRGRVGDVRRRTTGYHRLPRCNITRICLNGLLPQRTTSRHHSSGFRKHCTTKDRVTRTFRVPSSPTADACSSKNASSAAADSSVL